MTKKVGYRADLKFFVSGSLYDGSGLATLKWLLEEHAPQWASDLHIYQEWEKPPRREIQDFATDVRAVSLEHGELFEYLVATYGEGPSPRRSGTVEMRGANKALIVVVTLDDYQIRPLGGCYHFGNTIVLQICAPRVDGQDAAEFARRFASQAYVELSPWYARAHRFEEWDHKNMSHEGGGLMAIGLDISRYLPGLYWLNYFGEPYRDFIGKERLLSAPAYETREAGAGVEVLLDASPDRWESPEYQAVEKRTREHIGDQYFFDRHRLDRETVAPDFGVKPLKRHPRFK